MKWKDVTSYSHSDSSRVPRSWEADFGICQVTVHRLHGADGWYVSCRSLNISRNLLTATTAEEAKYEGLEYVRVTLQKMADAMKVEIQDG